MIINGSKFTEYRGLYLTQVSWNIVNVYRMFGKNLRHIDNIGAVDIDHAKEIVDHNYERLCK